MRNAKSRAPDDHERQPKNEFWTNFKKKLTERKVLVSSISHNFFSLVGGCLDVLEGVQRLIFAFFVFLFLFPTAQFSGDRGNFLIGR